MTTHDRVLEIAAAAIDFELSGQERGMLDAHLAGCSVCRHQVEALRADARAVASLPTMALSPTVSSAILTRVLRPPSSLAPMRLVAIAALLAILTLAAAAVGAALLQRAQDSRFTSVVPPTPGIPQQAPSSAASPTPVPATGQVLYQDELGEAIYVLDVVTGAATRLADGTGANWSPDGSRILYTSYGANDPQVWIMDADGGNPTYLVDGHWPVWSPDGSRIAFSRSTIDQGDLLVMNADGTAVRPLEGGNVFAWSPDGTQLATVTGVATPELLVVDADGTGSTSLAAGQYPVWSPDGTRISYVSWSEQPSLDVVDPGTGNVITVATDLGDAREHAWSPDGTRIAYTSGLDLAVVSIEGGGRVTLVPGNVVAYGPDWSSDGAWIVFVMQGPMSDPPPGDIWLVRSDGTDLRQLTEARTATGSTWRPVSP